MLPARLLVAAAVVAATVAGVPAAAQASDPPTRIGAVDMRPCDVLPGALCGSIRRDWDPTGRVPGTVRVGFAFVPASSGRSIGTLVPHEGGPGYSTTGSGEWFAEMYGDLLTDRDMLLVDQRGMGRTAPIACPALDEGRLPYIRAVGECARTLGDRAGLYGSALSADDLAAVLDALGIRTVDMYGDSYGTFFAQVFAGRHPDRLRTLVLDGAYPTYGESAWYPTQGPALRASIDTACARSIMCAAEAGQPVNLTDRVLRMLRRNPVEVRVPGGDGRLHRVTLTAPAVAAIAYNATYLPPTYREYAGALRAALVRDFRPLGRLYAEYLYTGEGPPNPREYSAGAEVAVSCQDYPQLFDLRLSRSQRMDQYRAAFARMQARRPDLYAPFSIEEYRRSGWTSFGMCLRWPQPAPGQSYGPPRPPSGAYPAVPTLVLSGELDTITTLAEGAMVTSQFPDARHVVVANGLHVVGGAGPDSCGARLVRFVVRAGGTDIPSSLVSCADGAPAIRSVGTYPLEYAATALPPGAPDDAVGRVAVTAANTAADLLDRWWQSQADHGRGLRGGA
ncbi:MAG: alpha/beta fold hydrolase, partial [Candidatus Nanopelagicales bacterium]